MQLRDYQKEGISKIKAAWELGQSRVMFQLPTGGGKSVCFAELAKDFISQGEPVLVIVHREELLTQARDHLQRVSDTPCGLIKAGYKPNADAIVQIASIQTLARRESLPKANLIIVDESHHAAAPSYKKLLQQYPQAKILGVTATPQRIDGYGFRDLFDILITCTTVASLIAEGYLSQYKLFGGFIDLKMPKRSRGDYGQQELNQAVKEINAQKVVENWLEIAPGRKTCLFAVNIDHSMQIIQEFLQQGISAAHIDAETPLEQRKAVIESFRRGDITVLSNVNIFTEGFDLPAIDCVVVARPTASVSMWLQMVGRALRPAPLKDYAIILDCTDNWFRLGKPDMLRTWSLDPVPADPDQPGIRRCPHCFHIFSPIPGFVKCRKFWDSAGMQAFEVFTTSCPNCLKLISWRCTDGRDAHLGEDVFINENQFANVVFKEIPPDIRPEYLEKFIKVFKTVRKKYRNSEKRQQQLLRELKDLILLTHDLTINEITAAIVVYDANIKPDSALAQVLVPALLACNNWDEVTHLMSLRPRENKEIIWSNLSKEQRSLLNYMKRVATDPNSIEIGDLVDWSQCPGYLDAWTPFRVTKIDFVAQTAMLDVFNKPVPLEELSLFVQQEKTA